MSAHRKFKVRERMSLTSCPFVQEFGMKFNDIISKDLTSVLQQDNVSKNFYMKIVDGDLKAAYTARYGTKPTKPKVSKHIIVVGGGISGLAAAYELEKVGYKTTVLELQNHIGGRIKTIHFDDGLICDAGAMRIPPVHFLTKAYIKRFHIETVEWENYNPKTYLYIYGNKIRLEDWQENCAARSSEFFPGWDRQIKTLKNNEQDVDGIDDYFTRTVEPLVRELCENIRKYSTIGWERWVEKWNTLSLEGFFRTDTYQDPTATQYRPWPAAAVEGFRVTKYAYPMERSLVEFLRFVIGNWWPRVLETPKAGMSILPSKFIEKNANEKTDVDLSKHIYYGIKVQGVEELHSGRVRVYGKNMTNGDHVSFDGDAVILTLPLTILRQLDINIRAFDAQFERAIGNVNYVPITKIFLQCRSRFWEKDVGNGGGSTKTTLPIGEIYYLKPHDNKTKRGILLCYAWGQDGLIMGSQSENEAVESAIKQISKIHPEITTEFEKGKVQAWFNDSAEQGGFTQLLPYQYTDSLLTLMDPVHPVYIAGEAVSYFHSWIQGALESGLTAAFNIYCHDQKQS